MFSPLLVKCEHQEGKQRASCTVLNINSMLSAVLRAGMQAPKPERQPTVFIPLTNELFHFYYFRFEERGFKAEAQLGIKEEV